MARVAGVDLPKNKRIDVALTYIHGIGDTRSREIMRKAGQEIKPATRVKDLTEAQVGLLNTMISKDFNVEGELRRSVQMNIKRFIEIGSYRGYRHRRLLPVRGQRTSTNARTRRGRRKTVGSGGASGAKAPPAKS